MPLCNPRSPEARRSPAPDARSSGPIRSFVSRHQAYQTGEHEPEDLPRRGRRLTREENRAT
jgi:hypothetical protein